MRVFVPLLLFALQLGAIVYARFVPTRYFCWAPYDTQTEYWANAIVDGRALTAPEFRHRYRRPRHGFDNRSPQHIIDMLQQVEQKRGALGEKASVVVEYRVNGKAPEVWRWPSSLPESETRP